MNSNELYELWVSKDLQDGDLLDELESIKGKNDEIHDRFYKNLEFGTGGLRGIIGAGTNRMNIHTVRWVTQSLSFYLNDCFYSPSVAIGYDTRKKSFEFAKQCAMVLAANRIKVYLYKSYIPTPCVSFAVKNLSCSSGIMITASHNPPEYNGYKLYGSDGCQITSETSDKILEYLNQTDIFSDIKYMDFDEALEQDMIVYVNEDVIEQYYSKVLGESLKDDSNYNVDLKVVYTPLNGAGRKPVEEILKRSGAKEILIVQEQENPDVNFTTCVYPNPESKDALNLGLELCKEKDADILIATDPDCDRVGVAVKVNQGEYKLISGNEMAVLLFNYICTRKKELGEPLDNGILVKTIVSTDMVKPIAQEYGVEVIEVLTGFKFIGEQILILESKNKVNDFVFGFEESYGYLKGTYVRDKDAVVASMLIFEMTQYYLNKGFNLSDMLDELYKKYGYYYNVQRSFAFEGSKGAEKIKQIMKTLREKKPKKIGENEVVYIEDYKLKKIFNVKTNLSTDIHFSESDVIAIKFDNDSIVLRPSGTEPKLKVYYSVKSGSMERCVKMFSELEKEFDKLIGV